MEEETKTTAAKPARKAAAEPAKPNVYQRLHAVMSEVGRLEKDKKNTHFNYSYLSEEAIKTHVQPLLIKHGLLFTLEASEMTREGTLTNAYFNYAFTNIDNPTDRVTGEFCGVGADNQDKGIWKATTGAIKYILTSTFLIPTGGDPEADASTDKAAPAVSNGAPAARPAARTGGGGSKPATQKQKDFLKKLMLERGYNGTWLTGKLQNPADPSGFEVSNLIEQLLAIPATKTTPPDYDVPEEIVGYDDEDLIDPNDVPF